MAFGLLATTAVKPCIKHYHFGLVGHATRPSPHWILRKRLYTNDCPAMRPFLRRRLLIGHHMVNSPHQSLFREASYLAWPGKNKPLRLVPCLFLPGLDHAGADSRPITRKILLYLLLSLAIKSPASVKYLHLDQIDVRHHRPRIRRSQVCGVL